MTVLPNLNEFNRVYWTAGADGVPHIHRCQDCSYWVHPPVTYCPSCRGRSVAPERASGYGTILTYTVNHQKWRPSDEVPFVLVIVALDEQENLRIMSRLVGAEPEDVRIGDRVRVIFEQHDEVWVPMVCPADEGHGGLT